MRLRLLPLAEITKSRLESTGLNQLRDTHRVREQIRKRVLRLLTRREFELLQYLVQNKNRVISRDRLLERVWGYDFGGNANIVEVYVKQLRQKIEGDGAPRLLQTIRGAGYVLREE